MPVAEVEVGIESTSQEADKKKPLAASSSVTFPEKLSGAHSLPAKKIRYLDMSIQDWSEADSSDSFNSTGLERNSPELTVGVSEIDLPEDDSQSCSLEADFFETGSFKTDSFKKKIQKKSNFPKSVLLIRISLKSFPLKRLIHSMYRG